MNQQILNALLSEAKRIFSENESLFAVYGKAFSLDQIIKLPLPASDREISIAVGDFKCSFRDIDVFYMLKRFSRLPGCKLDKSDLFTLSDCCDKVERMKVYVKDKKGNVKSTHRVVRWVNNHCAVDTVQDHGNVDLFAVVDGVGYLVATSDVKSCEGKAKYMESGMGFILERVDYMMSKGWEICPCLQKLYEVTKVKDTEIQEPVQDDKAEISNKGTQISEKGKAVKGEGKKVDKNKILNVSLVGDIICWSGDFLICKSNRQSRQKTYKQFLTNHLSFINYNNTS